MYSGILVTYILSHIVIYDAMCSEMYSAIYSDIYSNIYSNIYSDTYSNIYSDTYGDIYIYGVNTGVESSARPLLNTRRPTLLLLVSGMRLPDIRYACRYILGAFLGA